MTRAVTCLFDVQLPDDHTHHDLFSALHQAVAGLGGHVDGMVTFTEPDCEHRSTIFAPVRDADGVPLTTEVTT